jgi:hypothetical protein
MFQNQFYEDFGGALLARVLLLVLVTGGSFAAALEAKAQFGRTAVDNFGNLGAPIAYNFRDISATGTPLGLGDDASLYTWLSPLDDFSFDYFGTPYKWVSVCSNGFLSFSSDATPYQAQQLPGFGVENMIAGAWTDLDPAQGGEIYV